MGLIVSWWNVDVEQQRRQGIFDRTRTV